MNVVFCVVQYFELERKEKKRSQIKFRDFSFLRVVRIVGLLLGALMPGAQGCHLSSGDTLETREGR
jgi:hypothetical protein